MNSILAFVSSAMVVAAIAYYTGIANDEASLYILAAGGAAILIWRFVSKSHKQRAGRGESLLDSSDSPAAAFAYGLFRGVCYSLALAVIFSATWALGYWQPPFFHSSQSAHQLATKPFTNSLLSATVTTNAEVLQCENHYGVNFVEVAVPTGLSEMPYSSTALLDQFRVVVDGNETPVVSVERFDWEHPVAAYILRDCSGSMLRFAPFSGLVTASTEHVIDCLTADPRREKNLRIADFAGGLVVTCDWTDDLRLIRRPISLASPENQSSSAVAKHIVSAIDELKAKADCQRILFVESDFDNNVETSFDNAGIAAYANQNGVHLVLIGIPTAVLTGERVTVLKSLAAKTGGAYTDGSDKSHATNLQKIINGLRKPIPAYRLAIAGTQPLNSKTLSICVAIPKEKAPPSGTTKMEKPSPFPFATEVAVE